MTKSSKQKYFENIRLLFCIVTSSHFTLIFAIYYSIDIETQELQVLYSLT